MEMIYDERGVNYASFNVWILLRILTCDDPSIKGKVIR